MQLMMGFIITAVSFVWCPHVLHAWSDWYIVHVQCTSSSMHVYVHVHVSGDPITGNIATL